MNCQRIDLPGGDVVFWERPNLGEDAEMAFWHLLDTVPWKARDITIAGRTVKQPRLTSWHADRGVSYTYSGRTHHPLPWNDMLLRLKAGVERVAEHRFNSVLLNLYPNERASIGFHADDEPELGEMPVIASLSLGAEREFRFRPKPGMPGKLTKVRLSHGSVLIMRGETQRNWLHGIEKSRESCGTRINLTFRWTRDRDAARRVETEGLQRPTAPASPGR